MPPKKSGGAKGATKGKSEDESKGASKEKKGGTAVKVIIYTFMVTNFVVMSVECLLQIM
jgi:hypothetical protein